jgi:hypothetical protein
LFTGAGIISVNPSRRLFAIYAGSTSICAGMSTQKVRQTEEAAIEFTGSHTDAIGPGCSLIMPLPRLENPERASGDGIINAETS